MLREGNQGMTLSPAMGVILLLVMIFSGRAFRNNWKRQEPGWKKRSWLYGIPAGLSFAALAFIPLDLP